MSALGRAKFRLAALAAIPLLITACASTDPAKPKRPPDRKWYQGEMDTADRTFFIDSFFSNGR